MLLRARICADWGRPGAVWMFTVFISYRHQDSTTGWATAIQVHLKAVCGLDAFKDVDSLPPGVDWREHIREALQDCDVALVLIGSKWLNATDEQAHRRLDDPNDVLRFELAEVLSRENVRVIPVLFDSARMPEAERLPPAEPAIALPSVDALAPAGRVTSSESVHYSFGRAWR